MYMYGYFVLINLCLDVDFITNHWLSFVPKPLYLRSNNKTLWPKRLNVADSYLLLIVSCNCLVVVFMSIQIKS